MTALLVAAVAWTVISLPCAVVLGRVIRRADAEQEAARVARVTSPPAVGVGEAPRRRGHLHVA